MSRVLTRPLFSGTGLYIIRKPDGAILLKRADTGRVVVCKPWKR